MELKTIDLNQLVDDVAEDVARLKKTGGDKLLNFQEFVGLMKTVQVELSTE